MIEQEYAAIIIGGGVPTRRSPRGAERNHQIVCGGMGPILTRPNAVSTGEVGMNETYDFIITAQVRRAARSPGGWRSPADIACCCLKRGRPTATRGFISRLVIPEPMSIRT